MGGIKVVPLLLAGLFGAALSALRLGSDPKTLVAMMMLATPLVPVLVAKPLVYRHLRRLHAPDGFDRERRLRVSEGSTHWFDGRAEQSIAGEVAEIFDLRHSILLKRRDGGEIAIPTACFESLEQARRFAERLAALHEVKLRTSPWSAAKRRVSAVHTVLLALWLGLIGAMLAILVFAIGSGVYEDL